jgi:hypothetical protein
MRKKALACVLMSYMISVTYADALASAATTIQLEPYMGSTLTMRAEVNGHEGLFQFDTGGGESIISPDFAKTIGCTPWGRITGFRMTGERLDFQRCDNLHFKTAGVLLKAPTVGVLDIMNLLPKDAPHLDGSLGLDIFAGRTITFDESGKTLTIESVDSFKDRIRNAKEVPIRLVRDAEGIALTVDVAVPTSHGMAWMEMDSGNGGGVLVIAKYLADQFHLDPNKKDPQSTKFEIAGGIPVEGQAITLDLIKDGNIGAQFFRNWVLTVDLASGRAWLLRRACPADSTHQASQRLACQTPA